MVPPCTSAAAGEESCSARRIGADGPSPPTQHPQLWERTFNVHVGWGSLSLLVLVPEPA